MIGEVRDYDHQYVACMEGRGGHTHVGHIQLPLDKALNGRVTRLVIMVNDVRLMMESPSMLLKMEILETSKFLRTLRISEHARLAVHSQPTTSPPPSALRQARTTVS